MTIDWDKIKILLIESQAGDQNSYRELLSELFPWIQQKVRSKVFKSDDYEDIVQDTLISIHKALHTYDSSYEPAPWVFAITKRRIIDYIRKTGRKNDLFTENNQQAVTNHIGKANIESVREEFELLEDLPENLLRPILLTKIIGHSTSEAAQILNIKENALRTRISRGFRLIEKKLDGEKGV